MAKKFKVVGFYDDVSKSNYGVDPFYKNKKDVENDYSSIKFGTDFSPTGVSPAFNPSKALKTAFDKKEDKVLTNADTSANAPDEVFGSDSWEYFKKNHPDTPDFIKPFGYALETPYRIPVLNKFFGSASKSMGGENAIAKNAPMNMYSDTTGNKAIDKIAEMGGSMAGLGATPTNMSGGNLLNFADDIAIKGANAVSGGIKNKVLQGVTKGAARGAIDNSLGSVVDDMRFNGGNDIGGSALDGALGGALFGGALGGVSKGLEVGKGKVDKVIDNKFKDYSQGAYVPNFNKLDFKNVNDEGLKLKTPFSKSVEGPKFNEDIKTKIDDEIMAGIPRVTVKKDRIPGVEEWTSKPISERTIDDTKSVTSKKTNAIQYDYPDLMPHIQSEAKGVLNELKYDNIPGERSVVYDESGEMFITGNKKVEAPSIGQMQQLGLSYSQIHKGLNDLIEDNGKENNAIAKKVELVLDKNLTEGSVNVRGEELPPNAEYIDSKNVIDEFEKGIVNKPKFNNSTVFSGYDKPKVGSVELEKPKYMASKIEKPDNLDVEDGNTLTFDPGIKIDNDLGPGQDYSMAKYNTFKSSDFMSDPKVQEVVEEVQGIYDIKTNTDSFKNANKMLEEDYEGTVNRIRTNGVKSAEDTVASGLITKSLIEKAKVSGDYSEVKNWLEFVRPEFTSLGQTVQAISTWKRFSPEGTLLQAQKIIDSSEKQLSPAKAKEFKEQVAKANGDNELIAEIKKKFKVSDFTSEELSELVTRSEKIQGMAEGREKDIEVGLLKKDLLNKVPSTNADKIKAMQRINLLLNVKTLGVKNPLGNVGMGILENVKDIPGALLDKAISMKTGNRTTFAPSVEGVITQGKGLVEGAKNTLEDHKLGIDTSNNQGQYELKSSKAFKGDGGIIDKTMAKAEDLTNTALKLGDEPFYKAAYNESIRQQMKHNNVKVPTQEMKDQAIKIAEERTFQNDTFISKKLKELQKGLNFIGTDDFGLGNIILPFVKTPANILDKAIDYSPIGGIKGISNLVVGMKRGSLNQKQVVDQLSRGLTGTGMIALGMFLADSGVLTGDSPSDVETASLQKQSGILPYALKIGNTYNTIDWAQPFAMPLMIGADIQNNKKDGEKIDTALFNALKTGSGTLFNQSLLTGMSKLFGGYSMDSGQNLTEGILNSLMSVPGQFVPFNSALKQVNDLKDKNTRETYDPSKLQTEMNKITAKIPGLSEKLPKKIDTEGNEVGKFNSTKENPLPYLFNALFNPGNTSKFSQNNTEKTALNMYNESGETSQMPRVAGKTIKNGTETIQLNGAEKSELQILMGKATEDLYSNIQSDKAFLLKNNFEKAKYIQEQLTDIKKGAEITILKRKGIKPYVKEKKTKGNTGIKLNPSWVNPYEDEIEGVR